MKPQLTCGSVNTADGTARENVVYVTAKPDYNVVTLQVGLTSGSTVLSPGTIPDPLTEPPPAEGTTIYVDLTALGLSQQVWDALTCEGQGWKFRKFDDPRVVGMTPDDGPIPLSSGSAGVIPIEVLGVVVPEEPPITEVQVYVVYYNIPTVPGNYSTFPVAFVRAPDEHDGDLSTVIGASLSADGIVNTPEPELTAANRFSLRFTKLGLPVPAGPDTTFSVTFVYGAPGDAYGYGALAGVADASDFLVHQGDNADSWTITPDKNAQAVTWTLQPPDGAPIVGSGGQSVVAIDFSNVVTTYQPGPTVMLVSYRRVPGYKDGTFTLLLNKIAHVSIGALEVTPNPTCFQADGTAKVTVRWQVAAARSLELTQNYKTTPVTERTELGATLETESTTFALRATGQPGTVDNSDYRTVNAVAMPVTNSFTGAPTEIHHRTLAHDASFAWAVDSPSQVQLFSTGPAFSGQSYPATGVTSAGISQPQMVSLVPKSSADQLALTRRLVLSAFRPVPEQYTLPFTPRAAAASPSGPFVLLAGPSTSLTVVDTVRYAPGATHDLGHAATAIVFSPDGTVLATANDDRTVSIVGVELDAAGMPTFTNLATITLDHTPHQLVFSPGLQRIFLTLDPGGDTPGQALALVRTKDGYKVEGQPVTVGRAPRGLTLDAAGARLFVANSGDQTVTMIGLTREGKLGTATTLSGFEKGPTGIVATPNGRQLLVSCAGPGTVVVLDPSRPERGQRSTLPVGRAPGQIALLPSGSYAAVANSDDGTISLIDCRSDGAAIPGPPVTVGARPTGITASPDGLQVLVAVDGGFCVVTLATYQAADARPAMPNRPTSTAVTPDGSTVFAWHDSGLVPESWPGVLVYDTMSRTTSNLLADRDVLRLVASPDPLAKQAFAIVEDDRKLYEISVESLDTRTFPLGLPSGTTPVALAVSGSGRQVYVVAANATRDLTFAVLTQSGNAWIVTQTVPLYRTTGRGRILLRSTPDGSTVFVVDTTAATVHVLRRTGPDYVLSTKTITGERRANDLAVAPDGLTAWVLNAGGDTNTITVVDVGSLDSHIAAVPQSYVNLTTLQPAPDGRRLFATDTNAAALRVFDPRSLRIIQTVPLVAGGGEVRGVLGIAVAADGSAVYTANTESQNLAVVEQIQMGATAVSGVRLLRSTLDTPYSGLFLRHYLGDKPGSPPDGFSASPDLIPFGLRTAPDSGEFTTVSGYARDWGENVVEDNGNYIYVRGLNAGPTEITSRVYFYHTRGSLSLWPANWRSDKVTVNNVDRNWVDVTAGPGSVALGAAPYIWTPDKLDPGTDHYCTIAWASDGPDPQPPDLATYSRFASLDELVYFVVTHHNLAWRNVGSYSAPPPNDTYTSALEAKDAGISVYLQVGFKDIPLDGTFSVNVPGTDKDNTVSMQPSPLRDYQGGFMPKTELAYPAGFSTSVRIQYWKGTEPLPETAQIRVKLLVSVDPAMVSDIERRYRPIGLRTPIVRLGGIPVVVAGTTHHELRFGQAVR